MKNVALKENIMTFEEILPGLKAKKKYVRTGWGGQKTMSNFLTPSSKTGLHLK